MRRARGLPPGRVAATPVLRAVVLAAVLAALGAAQPAHAQGMLDRIKSQTKQKLDDSRKRAEDGVANTTGRLVDSTLEKTGRGVDGAVAKVGSAVDTTISKTERGVTSLAAGLTSGGGGDREAAYSAGLANGRLALRDLAFATGTPALAPGAAPGVKALARALQSVPGPFLIEGHADDGGDAAKNQALSEQRAAALKVALVAEGVPAARLFALGFGAARQPTDGGAAARLELARMQ